MPDITMCTNENCKKNGECYRYRAYPDQRQSVTFFNENRCNYFWEIRDKDIIRPLLDAKEFAATVNKQREGDINYE